jgi:hypothetical protein
MLKQVNILVFGMRRFVYVIVMMFCVSGLNAQNKQNKQNKQSIDVQQGDSVDIKKRDSVLLKRIDSEDLFHKKIAKIDSTVFDNHTIKKRLKARYSDYRRWRFGLNGGIELIIAPELQIPEELLKYKKTLKLAPRFGADALFFTTPNVGIGITYSTYNVDNEINYISYEVNNTIYEGERRDDIHIHFIGPTISIRSIPKHNKFYTSCDFILGYFTYSNNLILNNIQHNLKKDNFGFATSVGADFMFTRNISLGISLNITAASIKNVEILSGNNVENLSRVSLVMSLRTYR